MRNEKGFTLTELMVVIAITGILMSIAIAQYRDHMIKTILTEAISLGFGYRSAMLSYYAQTGKCPTNSSGTSNGGITNWKKTGTKYIAWIRVGGSGTQGTISLNGVKAEVTCTVQIQIKADMMADLGSKNLVMEILMAKIEGTDSQFIWGCSVFRSGASKALKKSWVPRVCLETDE